MGRVVNQQELSSTFIEFVRTIAKLRDPIGGCPWDKRQNHESLRKYMIEEAYEASAAMADAEDNPQGIQEELGDVLLQVVLNARLAEEAGKFSIIDVIQSIDRKMKTRHPHVFAAKTPSQEPSEDFLRSQWDRIKGEEKRAFDRGLYQDKELAVFPAARQALKIGTIAKKIAFDWENLGDVIKQFESELTELKSEISLVDGSFELSRVKEEIGDLYFTLAQVCRFVNLDPEVVAQDGNRKFLRRFRVMEQIAQEKGGDITECSPAEKEQLWQLAKSKE